MKTLRHISLGWMGMAMMFGLWFLAGQTFSQTILYSTVASTYTQDYDGLPNSGTFTFTGLDVRALSDPPISAAGMGGWYFVKNTGTGTNDLFSVDAGSGTSGGVRSYGSVSATDRALGGLASGTYAGRWGALITNNTGVTLNEFTITYTGEQWRANNTSPQSITFDYKVGAAAINDATGFVSVPALNFTSPVTSTAGALDGNDPANRTPGITATVAGITWLPGAVLAIRWTDMDDPGSDHGLAIDDFTFTANVATITNFYYNGTGALHLTGSWGTNTDGTGTNPSNFSDNYQVFNIRNTTSVSTSAAWTVSGAGSKIVLGDASVAAITLTVTGGNPMSGTIDIAAAMSGSNALVLQDAAVPTFGAMDASALVVYDGAVPQSITVTTYPNLTLSNTGTKSFGGGATTVQGNLIINNTTINAPGSAPFATVNLGGDLTYLGTVTNPPDANSITLNTSGSGVQTITGNGNTARWFRLITTTAGNNVVLSTSGGSTNLLVGNASGGGITLATGTTLTLNSNTLTFFDGNVSIGAGLGVINVDPASNIVINKNGNTPFGTLRLSTGAMNNLTVNMHTGTATNVTLGTDATVGGVLTLTSGTVTTGVNTLTAGGTVSRTNGHVVGNLRKPVSVGNPSRTFEIGDDAAYRPVAVEFTNVSITGNLTAAVSLTAGDHPQIGTAFINPAKSVNRYWTLTNDGIVFDSYDATFTFVGGDVDPGADTDAFIVGKYDGSGWSYPTVGARTSTSTEITGATSFSDFAIGELLCGTITLSPATLPGGTQGQPYNEMIGASGGIAPHTFAVTAGSLPPGLSLSGGGVLSGTPSTPGIFNFTVTATDALGCTGVQAYALEIVCPTITLSPATLPGGTVGQSYSQTITASGGTAPYSYGVTAGTLPPGLDLASNNGELSGTPTTPGTFNFTVTATDDVGCTGEQAYTVEIEAAPAPVYFLSLDPDSIFNEDPAKPGKSMKPAKRGKGLMPNWSNLLAETVLQGGFAPGASESDDAGGMVIGVSHMEEVAPDKWKPIKDSAAVRAWVRLSKWNFKKEVGTGWAALQKTLRNKDFNHYDSDPTLTPRGFDSTGYPGLAGRKPMKKQLSKLDPKKTPNKLFAELVALKFNIAASQMEKTPAGFGDLIYVNPSSGFDGMSVMDISAAANQMMTYWQGVDQADYDDLYSVVYAINRAFLGPIDTVSFEDGGKLVLKGAVDINDVPFLELPPGPRPFVATTLTPRNSYVEGFEDDFADEEWDEMEGVPIAAKLYQNYPNPFNPSTTISFKLRNDSYVTLKIFNVLGQEVMTLLNGEELEEGYQTVEFRADRLASGVYFYHLRVEDVEGELDRTVVTKKMLLLK